MSRKEIFIGGVAAVVVVLFSNYVFPVITTSYTGWLRELIIGLVFVPVMLIYFKFIHHREARKHYHRCAGASDGCMDMVPPGTIYCNCCSAVSVQDGTELIGAR